MLNSSSCFLVPKLSCSWIFFRDYRVNSVLQQFCQSQNGEQQLYVEINEQQIWRGPLLPSCDCRTMSPSPSVILSYKSKLKSTIKDNNLHLGCTQLMCSSIQWPGRPSGWRGDRLSGFLSTLNTQFKSLHPWLYVLTHRTWYLYTVYSGVGVTRADLLQQANEITTIPWASRVLK